LEEGGRMGWPDAASGSRRSWLIIDLIPCYRSGSPGFRIWFVELVRFRVLLWIFWIGNLGLLVVWSSRRLPPCRLPPCRFYAISTAITHAWLFLTCFLGMKKSMY
jgi:hypothetical protein